MDQGDVGLNIWKDCSGRRRNKLERELARHAGSIFFSVINARAFRQRTQVNYLDEVE